MDFNKGFPTEINLTGENFSWSQKLDYENVSFDAEFFLKRTFGNTLLKRAKASKETST
jgi:hypothetical protein